MAISAQLCASDRHLREAVARSGVPQFWARPAGFPTLALLIVEQQVSLGSAKAVFDRLRNRLGQASASRLAALDESELRACGLTRQKASYLSGLARSILAGDFDVDALEHHDDGEARARLLSIRGIGSWTADAYLLSALRRPDIWPVGDRALQVGAAEVLGLDSPATTIELESLGERWRPLRSVAARLIWHDYLSRRGRRETLVDGLEDSEETDR